jgi:hypothetical protein
MVADGELVGRRHIGRNEFNARLLETEEECALRDRRSSLAITHLRTCYQHWTVLRLQNLWRPEWGPPLPK